jgi:hypothetical protein
MGGGGFHSLDHGNRVYEMVPCWGKWVKLQKTGGKIPFLSERLVFPISRNVSNVSTMTSDKSKHQIPLSKILIGEKFNCKEWFM